MSVSRRSFSETTLVITKLKERKTMERITSKLTRVLVITLLSAATLATVGSLTLKASTGVTPQAKTPITSIGRVDTRTPVKSIGRVSTTATTSTMSTTSTPDNRSICDKAQDSRKRNSPAAPTLEAMCLASLANKEEGRENELAARGAAIENQYPWAAERRSQQPNDAARRGFDIGMAAAEGQTAPNPGQQGIHDSLSPAEQQGYSMAVSLSLLWNKTLEETRNELAVRGAALASADQEAAGVRNQQAEGDARRGFDIGMAAAAEVDSSGAGKQAIRAALNPEEQRGFDTAVLYSQLRKNNPIGAAMASEDPLAAREADVASAERSASEPRPLPRRPVRRGNDSRSLGAALEQLRQGKEYLEGATPDQDGHLYKAIDDINNAIQELEKALRERLN